MPSSDRPSSSVCSYSSVHDELGAKAQAYSGKYQQFVLDYAVEWERVVKERVENGIKKSNESRVELDHYQKKVESLRLTVNQAMAKGKPVSATTKEKLHRNEEKFLASKERYNTIATDLCILIEEVTERQWRDLHPLLIKCAQFDMTLSSDEAKVLSNLNTVIGSLKKVATEQGISPQPRLKDLAGLKPELLTTRPGGVAGLAIEAGGSTITQEAALPPGSVGAQGIGGYPIQISPSNNVSTGNGFDPIPRTGSQGSMHSAPGLAGTAPSFDDIYATLPPAPLSGNNAVASSPLPQASPWSVRSSSFNDADSAYSGYSNVSAPPMSAPPPPPTAPPPLPPQTPGYASQYPQQMYNTQQAYNAQQYQGFSPQKTQAVNPLSLYGSPPPPKPNHNPFG